MLVETVFHSQIPMASLSTSANKNSTRFPDKLTTVHPGKRLSRHQGGPFLGFAEIFSALIARKKLPDTLATHNDPLCYQECIRVGGLRKYQLEFTASTKISNMYAQLHVDMLLSMCRVFYFEYGSII